MFAPSQLLRHKATVKGSRLFLGKTSLQDINQAVKIRELFDVRDFL
jgi:hypothetical protein